VELYAHGLGVIDDARLEFGPGFNVLTGETGAGKTLLLDALGLSLGGDPSDTRYALRNETRAVALFIRDDEELLFSRESTTSGRLRSSLNGVPSSAESLRAVAAALVVVHGQHDSLALRNKGEVLKLIDTCGSVQNAELARVRNSLREVRQLRDGFGGDEATRDRESEFVHFQLDELDRATLRSPNELNDAIDELTRISELRDGQLALTHVIELFDADSDAAVLAQFARALAELPRGTTYDDARTILEGSLIQAREALRELVALSDPETYDVTRLQTLEDRVGELRALARKYGGSIEAAIVIREKLRSDLVRAHQEAQRMADLDGEIRELELEETTIARQVRDQRERAATKLSKAVCTQLARVALANASLRFVVDGSDGSNVQILFTPNPGGVEGPLASMASGGELSRVLLAISLETANEDLVAVFDEIDAGLGGQIAQKIGECLREVGQRQQVLAVTHLASVAAKADHHFTIEKQVHAGVTTTRVRELVGDERVREIARMLVGDLATPASYVLAKQMLENSHKGRVEADFFR
jgi:DNA repair protein RecN (Recombination protein N)